MNDSLPWVRRVIDKGTLGTKQTLEQMGLLAIQAAHDPKFIDHARAVVSALPNKAYRREADALFRHVKKTVRYVYDPFGLELVADPRELMFVLGSEDCFPVGTRVLRQEGHALVGIETLRKGDRIWGRDRWSLVENVWDKGTLPTWAVRLNNGAVQRLTPDHKVWAAECPHDGQTRKIPCHCRMADRELRVVHVRDLKVGMCMLQPESVGYGTGEMDPDLAYLDGLFLSDGWSSDKYRFCISGRDGFPKEEQKREVQAICARYDVNTTWHKRHIGVHGKEWTQRMQRMGDHATNKRALTIDLQKDVADRLLDGMLSDAGRNTTAVGMTFSTTSRDLWLQVRVLLKQRGYTCSSRVVVNHGGLGLNPIWRLGVRGWDGPETVRGKARVQRLARPPKASGKLLRVKEVIRDGLALPCVDVQTDDKHVWLPEADWTVHNCDGHSTLVAALAMAIGHQAAFTTVAVDCDPRFGDELCPWSHVYPMIGVPVGNRVEWLGADTTQAESFLGWQPEQRVTKRQTWVITPPD